MGNRQGESICRERGKSISFIWFSNFKGYSVFKGPFLQSQLVETPPLIFNWFIFSISESKMESSL